MSSPLIPSLPAEEDSLIIPVELDNDGIAQTWFRFLHLLGNPVDLCRPKVISCTPKFLSAAVSYQPAMEPHQFACLQALPHIFLKAMRGVSVVIDAFLGEFRESHCFSSHCSFMSGKTIPASAQFSKAVKQIILFRNIFAKGWVTPNTS